MIAFRILAIWPSTTTESGLFGAEEAGDVALLMKMCGTLNAHTHPKGCRFAVNVDDDEQKERCRLAYNNLDRTPGGGP